MQIHVFTLFPQMFEVPLNISIFKRAVEQKLVEVHVHNIRDFTHDKHHVVDDAPYGGGAGMVLKPEPIFEAVESVRNEIGSGADLPIVLLTPQGRIFNQKIAGELSKHERLFLICGHYEGVDERVREHLATDEISIGDYVLTGGELPALVLIDAVFRLLPGVLAEGSPVEESHAGGLLEYPHYTRPEDFRGWKVPDMLLSGNHAQIAKWRREQSLRRTLQKRPDLLEKAELTPQDLKLLKKIREEN